MPEKSETPLGQARDSDELLEVAGVCIAIWEDGRMRVVRFDAKTVQVIDEGATIYTPKDMLIYVTLSEHERRMLHSFKRRFGGTTEWQNRAS